MWERANIDRDTYENTAAFYLGMVLEAHRAATWKVFKHWAAISVFELMIASDAAVKNHILGSLEGELAASPNYFMERCTSMINKIESSCGGFLELGPSGEMANKINP